nr:hypothetical protein [Mucilaginibacter sp. FT3.2]
MALLKAYDNVEIRLKKSAQNRDVEKQNIPANKNPPEYSYNV